MFYWFSLTYTKCAEARISIPPLGFPMKRGDPGQRGSPARSPEPAPRQNPAFSACHVWRCHDVIRDWILQGKPHATVVSGCQRRSQNTPLANAKGRLYFGCFLSLDRRAILFHSYRSNMELHRYLVNLLRYRL